MAPNSAGQWNGSSRARSADPLWIALAACSIALALASRFAHLPLLWIEEAYGLAAAREILHGKSLYGDIWFDKPPLYAWYYVLTGGNDGWPLRLLGCGLIATTVAVVFGLGRQLWGVREGLIAAGLISLALTFWIPSAVIAAAPDMLMIVPHVAAVWLALERRPFLAGVASGIAVLTNAKGVLVLAAAAIWAWPALPSLGAGFFAVQAVAFAVLPAREYWEQVWMWGFRYSADTFVQQPLREGVVRSAAWAGFHATAVVGAAVFLVRSRDWRFLLWIAIAAAGVVGGLRFFPRYYFHLLPAVSLAGARGLMLMRPRWRAAALALLLVPVVRFGPRYISLPVAGPHGWADTAMMSDSRQAAGLLRTVSKPDDTLLVWGYRPDIFVFSGLRAGTPFLDSQPLTGVLADRHLTSAEVSLPEVATRNRAALPRYRPDYVVDGLGPLNPALGIDRYPDLRQWLRAYDVIGRTPMSVVYGLRSGHTAARLSRNADIPSAASPP